VIGVSQVRNRWLTVITGLTHFIVGLAMALVLLSPAGAATNGEAIRVQGGPWLLAGRVFESPQLSAHPHLVLVLHGDAPFVNPTYQYVFAKSAADAMPDVVVAALLRPGYRDKRGAESQGSRGLTTADNYTADRIASIAAAARSLMTRYRASDLTLVGHSGGSAMAADILALDPHLAKRALLVSCPCDVPASCFDHPAGHHRAHGHRFGRPRRAADADICVRLRPQAQGSGRSRRRVEEQRP
jgi:poly(3-hydroxybutyrate) depolymerase